MKRLLLASISLMVLLGAEAYGKGGVMQVTDNNIHQILSSDNLVIIDFYASWCKPCRMMAPVIEKLARKYKGRVIVCRCDVDDYGEMATAYGVRNIPNIVFFFQGNVVDRSVGLVPKETLIRKIQNTLAVQKQLERLQGKQQYLYL